MNDDLIEKLKEKATYREISHGAFGEPESYGRLDEELFAQLIIQECCNAIRHDDAYNGGKFMRTIKQHFGMTS